MLQATDLPLPTGPLMPRKKVLSFIKDFKTSPSGLYLNVINVCINSDPK